MTNTIIGWYQIGINASNGIAAENYNLYFANLLMVVNFLEQVKVVPVAPLAQKP